jgi:hypothetical protein
MQKDAILCEGGASQPGTASVHLIGEGQVQLVFCELPEGEPRAFTCSLSSLLDVALGFKLDLISESGSCLITRGPGRIIMTVGAPKNAHAMYLVPEDTYTDALFALVHAKAHQELALTHLP